MDGEHGVKYLTDLLSGLCKQATSAPHSAAATFRARASKTQEKKITVIRTMI